MIDKKGKLFGKINIIDLLIVLLILVFLIGGYFRLTKVNTMQNVNDEDATMVLLLEDVNESFTKIINKDDPIRDSVRGFELGVVKDVHIEEHKELLNENNTLVYKSIPGKYDIEITLDVKGIFDGDGLLISSKRYFVGSETRIKSSLFVSDADVLEIIKK